MGRRPQPQIRDDLLEACTQHALAHGLPDRLEALAVATGTSSRMLIYHFGTRRALQLAVLERARRRQQEVFGELLQARRGEPYGETLARAWDAISGAEGRPFLRLFSQWGGGAEPWPDFRRSATTDWLGPLEQAVGGPELATLVLAVLRGLLMDLDATGERERVDRAFRAFLLSVCPAGCAP